MAKKKSPFTTPSERVKLDYGRAIQRLIARQLPLFPGATIEQTLEQLNRLVQEEGILELLARKLSARMVTMVSKVNARNWREAAMQASRGRAVYESLRQEMQGPTGMRVQQLVRENARLISSIPGDVREMANREILRMQQEGLRPEAITKYLRSRIPELTKNRARLIARTETAKADTALTQSRSEQLGIAFYTWSSSRDSRVRASHRNLDQVVVPWNTPPQPEQLIGESSNLGPGHAGEFPNCRCVSLPVVSLETLDFPIRIFWNNRIQRMSRAQFLAISGMMRAA